jgi:hypothetical protein
MLVQIRRVPLKVEPEGHVTACWETRDSQKARTSDMTGGSASLGMTYGISPMRMPGSAQFSHRINPPVTGFAYPVRVRL